MHTRLEASEKREDLKIITEGKTEEKNYARRQIKRTDDYKKYTALHCLLWQLIQESFNYPRINNNVKSFLLNFYFCIFQNLIKRKEVQIKICRYGLLKGLATYNNLKKMTLEESKILQVH